MFARSCCIPGVELSGGRPDTDGGAGRVGVLQPELDPEDAGASGVDKGSSSAAAALSAAECDSILFAKLGSSAMEHCVTSGVNCHSGADNDDPPVGLDIGAGLPPDDDEKDEKGAGIAEIEGDEGVVAGAADDEEEVASAMAASGSRRRYSARSSPDPSSNFTTAPSGVVAVAAAAGATGTTTPCSSSACAMSTASSLSVLHLRETIQSTSSAPAKQEA